MKHVSRRYLREKWENVKWDMEKVLKIYEITCADRISEEDLAKCDKEIALNMRAILKELGYGE